MSSNDIADWFRRIPLLTKYWFSASIIVPLTAKLGLVSVRSLLLDYSSLVHGFQIWRPLTALLYFPTGFPYLLNIYFLYNYSTQLETGVFDGRPADYLFLLLFNWICLVLVALMIGLPLIMSPMILSILYVWCQFNRDQIVQFWFGTQFKAMYLPWVLALFNIVLGGSGFYELLGILVGHVYFFLMYKYPQDFGGRQLLTVPSFLYRWLPNRRGGVAGFGMPPLSQQRRTADAQGGGRHQWGRGQQLGDN
jgi:derlin-1